MESTSWEKALRIRNFKQKMYQKQLLEQANLQTQNTSENGTFDKELKVIVERVLEITKNFNVTTIFIHVNEKQRKVFGNVVKVSVTAEGEYTRNVYFHCSWKEAYTLIKGVFEKEGIPHENAGTFDGFVIKIV